MADMKVAMTLTVQDLGTVKLQRFNDVLKSVGDQVSALNDRFKAAIAGASDFGKATSDAADGVTALSRASAGAVRSTGKLGDMLKVMQDSLLALNEKLGAVADSMAEMAASTADLSAASKGAAAGIAAIGDAAGVAEAKLSKTHGTMKGLIELYGAFKIGEGLKKSVEVASDYQQERAQMQLMGIPRVARATMLQQAAQLQKLPGVSKLSALEAALGGYAAVPGAGPAQTQIREALMPEAMRAAMVLKSSFGDKTPIGTVVRNILGSVEMMGKLENIPQALQGIREVLQIAEGSHGKITPINLETALRNTAYGESLRYSKQGLFTVEALHEQFKAAGGAGGAGGNTKAGTIAGMVAAMQMGGRMQKIQALMLEQLGLLKPQDVLKIRGTSTVYVRPGILPHSAEGLRNPIQWVHDVLDPHIAALIHKEHPGLTGAAFNARVLDWGAAYAKASGGGNVGTGIVLTREPEQWARLMNTRAQMERAATPGKGIHILQGTLAFKQKEMLAKLETVGVELGTALLPALQALATWATTAAHAISWLNEKMPVFAKLEAWGAALAATLLGIKGVEWLMGIREGFIALKGVELGKAMLSTATSAVGLSGNLAMASAKMLGAAGAAGVLGYAVGSLLNDLINASGRAITGNKNWSLGGQIYQWTHAAPGSFSKLRHGANVPIGVRYNNPGDLMPGGHLAHYASSAYGLAQMALLLKGPMYAGGGLDTIQKIVTKYAPHRNAAGQIINHTRAYIAGVANSMRMSPTAKLNLNDPAILDHLMVGMLMEEGTLKYYNPKEIQAVAASIAHAGGSPAIVNHSLQNEETQMAAMTAHAAHAPGLGYTGPVTAAGLAKAAAIKAKAAAHAKAVAAAALRAKEATERHVRLAFRRKMLEDERLTRIAGTIRGQYQGIFNPVSSKIPEILTHYRQIADEIRGLHPHAAQEAMAVAHHKVLQVHYQMANDHLRQLQRNLHLGVTDNAALVKAGVISHATAAQRDIALQQQMAPQMIKVADAALQYAKAMKDPALVASLQEQIANLKAMGQQLGYYQEKVKGVLKSSFSGLLDQMMKGQKTWGQMLYSFFGSIANGIDSLISKKISNAIVDSLFSGKGGGGLGSAIGALFGAGNSPAAGTSSGGGILGGLVGDAGSLFGHMGSWLSSIGLSFATGADYIPHDLVAQLHKGEMVVPSGPAEAIRSGAMGAGHTLHLNIQALDGKSVLDVLHPISREISTMLMGENASLNLQGAY